MHRQELRSWGVVRLGLFGSFVRGGEGPESDVDAFVEFAPGKKGFTAFMELAFWLEAVAAELNRPLAQVALAWVSAQPGVTAPILGVSKLEQLHGNLASLEVELTPEQLRTLDKASALSPAMPSSILIPETKGMIFGGASVEGWR